MPYNQPYMDPNDKRYSSGGYQYINGEWVRNDDAARNRAQNQNNGGAGNVAPGGTTHPDMFGTQTYSGGEGQDIARDMDRFGKDAEAEITSAPGSVHQGIRDGIGKAWDQMSGAYNPNQISLAGAQQASGPYGGQDAQSRDMQMQLMQQLQQQAAGTGPSIAQLQLQKGTDQNISQAMALGASQRGAGQAGMMKGIAQQQAQIGQGMANDSAMLRLQEQMQARQALGSGLQGMRSGDQAFAGMQQQGNQFNAQQRMDAEKLRQETQLAYEKMREEHAKNASPMGAIGGALGMLGKM